MSKTFSIFNFNREKNAISSEINGWTFKTEALLDVIKTLVKLSFIDLHEKKMKKFINFFFFCCSSNEEVSADYIVESWLALRLLNYKGKQLKMESLLEVRLWSWESNMILHLMLIAKLGKEFKDLMNVHK